MTSLISSIRQVMLDQLKEDFDFYKGKDDKNKDDSDDEKEKDKKSKKKDKDSDDDKDDKKKSDKKDKDCKDSDEKKEEAVVDEGGAGVQDKRDNRLKRVRGNAWQARNWDTNRKAGSNPEGKAKERGVADKAYADWKKARAKGPTAEDVEQVDELRGKGDLEKIQKGYRRKAFLTSFGKKGMAKFDHYANQSWRAANLSREIGAKKQKSDAERELRLTSLLRPSYRESAKRERKYEEITEAFRLSASHPTGSGKRLEASAKNHKEVQERIADLRKHYPEHQVMVHHTATGRAHTFRVGDKYDPAVLEEISMEDIENDEILQAVIIETLGKDAEAGDWIHDFVHSNNPKFKGKSKKKRIKQALAAYYDRKRHEGVDFSGTLLDDYMNEAIRLGIKKKAKETLTDKLKRNENLDERRSTSSRRFHVAWQDKGGHHYVNHAGLTSEKAESKGSRQLPVPHVLEDKGDHFHCSKCGRVERKDVTGRGPAFEAINEAAPKKVQLDDNHIVSQLAKVKETGGRHPVKFADGSKCYVHPTFAHKALDAYEGLRTPLEKEIFAKMMHQNRQSLTQALSS